MFILSTVMETGSTEIWALYQLKRNYISSKICSLLAIWVCSVVLWCYEKQCRNGTLVCTVYL